MNWKPDCISIVMASTVMFNWVDSKAVVRKSLHCYQYIPHRGGFSPSCCVKQRGEARDIGDLWRMFRGWDCGAEIFSLILSLSDLFTTVFSSCPLPLCCFLNFLCFSVYHHHSLPLPLAGGGDSRVGDWRGWAVGYAHWWRPGIQGQGDR